MGQGSVNAQIDHLDPQGIQPGFPGLDLHLRYRVIPGTQPQDQPSFGLRLSLKGSAAVSHRPGDLRGPMAQVRRELDVDIRHCLLKPLLHHFQVKAIAQSL
jgi:hypothetical protein